MDCHTLVVHGWGFGRDQITVYFFRLVYVADQETLKHYPYGSGYFMATRERRWRVKSRDRISAWQSEGFEFR
jgi:hypothetical protein